MRLTIRYLTVMVTMLGLVLPAGAQSGKEAEPQTGRFQVDSKADPLAAQVFNPEYPSTGCEVAVMKVSFERPARFMPVAGGPQSKAPSLSVEIGNHSTKKVKSIDLVARMLVKDDIYQLDSTTREYPVHLQSIDGVQRVEMADSAMGIESLVLAQVTYVDGSTWKPEHRLACGYRGLGSISRAK
jgi:hypothetical protein